MKYRIWAEKIGPAPIAVMDMFVPKECLYIAFETREAAEHAAISAYRPMYSGTTATWEIREVES
ncbi:MAG: hypothetical protein H7099_17570 [Gemmatimonadaceae bacterium]|nr:hypothetical protein [Gemmatimonadaceae bacterium]